MAKHKPILCLDFDGVIHSYGSGWRGTDIIPDPPVEGAFEAIERYVKRFNVQIYSSRSHQPGGVNAMKAWFFKHGWPCYDDGQPMDLGFPTGKPAAMVSIDDRAITFDGTFPSVGDIFRFRPWNKRSTQAKPSKTFDS